MITNNDIADAIAKLMEEAFPGETLYRDFVPTGFERPSNLLQLLDGKAHPNFSCGSVEIRPRFMLSTFVPVDPYDHGDAMELTRRQMILMGLFLPGYIKVKDRAPMYWTKWSWRTTWTRPPSSSPSAIPWTARTSWNCSSSLICWSCTSDRR